MRVVLAADKFKGSLGALEVADALRRGLVRTAPGATVVRGPVADGRWKPTVVAPALQDVGKALVQQIKTNKSAWQWIWIVEDQMEKSCLSQWP